MTPIRASFLTLLAASSLLTAVRAETFTDSFDADHNYATGDTTGTIWDGIRGTAKISAMDANITNAGELRLYSPQTSSISNGPFLYKNLTGNMDFTSTLHVSAAAGDGTIGLLVANPSNNSNYISAYGVPSNSFTYFEANGAAIHGVWGTMGASKWFRLVRTAGVYTAFRSDNGSTWTQYTGSHSSVGLSTDVQVGLSFQSWSANTVTNRYGSFTLEVSDPPPPGPLIPGQPQPVTMYLGGTATFSVTATGTGTLLYHWRLNGSDIDGATGDTYTINSVGEEHAGTYSVVVTDDNGSTPSNDAVLMIGPPHLTGQPQSLRADLAGTATFSVTATGAAPLQYRWRKNTVDIDGAIGDSYTINPVSGDSVGTFSVVVSDAHGTTPSDNATLVIDVPVITVQPQPLKAVPGGTASFSVIATSPHPMEYQWRLEGTDIDGATGDSYTIPSVSGDHAGNYSVVVTNSNGPTTSASAALEVLPAGSVYQDSFQIYHDFAGGDVTGTMWDGVLNAQNLDPGTDTTGGVLHLPNGAEGIGNCPTLYKTVPAGVDFDVQVYIPSMPAGVYASGGLIARTASASPLNWVAAYTLPANQSHYFYSNVNGGGATEQFWGSYPPYLRLQRVGTTFNYYNKSTAGGTWSLVRSVERTDLTGELLVGIWHDNAAGSTDWQFDNFSVWMAPGGVSWIPVPVQIQRAANGAVTLSWPSQTGIAYKVEVSADLTSWAEYATGIPATDPVTSYDIPPGSTPDPATAPRLFYRVHGGATAP
ncbi:MAG: immunoglobulin domain-containing protein [Verrucomicrobia bacterium]|nr:immunoglobulin domain-containing protein [Verrucomicrobiota bacterium]